MDLAHPGTVVLSPGLSAVLKVLCGADAAFTVRHLARLAGVSHSRVADVVDRLAAHGLVLVEYQGRAKLCRFNADHLAAGAVTELVQMRARLLEILRQTIAAWAVAPHHASLFGSAARGDGTTASDIDVLLVRPDGIAPDEARWTDQLSVGAERLGRATGNQLAWFDVSADEVRRAVRACQPIVDEWRRDALHLAGAKLRQVLTSAA